MAPRDGRSGLLHFGAASRWRGAAGARILGALWLGAVAVLTLPPAVHPMLAGGEYQYQAALTAAFRDHLQWGTQVIWPYGPLGYFNVPAYMDFGTWLPAFAANLLAHVLFFAVLVLFLVRIRAGGAQWFALGAIVLAVFARYPGFEFERFPVLDHKAALIAVLLLYLATESPGGRDRNLLAAGAGLAVAFLLLDKGNYLVFAAGLVTVFGALALTGRRPRLIAALLGGIAVGFVALWLAAGQDIVGVPAYIRSSYELIAGYAGAMAWFSEAPAANVALQQGISEAMLAVAGLGVGLALWRRDRPLLALLLLSLPLLLVAYRNSFIRFDEARAVTFWSLAAVVLGLVHVLSAGAGGGLQRKLISTLAGSAVVASMVLVLALGPLLGSALDVLPLLPVTDNLTTYPQALELMLRPGVRSAKEAEVRAALLVANPLPPEVVSALDGGSVEVIPLDAQLPFAYGFASSPQPVIQSYAAYRPWLDDQDAQHLLGTAAPRFVIYSAASIDGRYPLFDEPATYRALLERYALRYFLPDMLVFERREGTAPATEAAAGVASARLGDWIAVPRGGSGQLYGRIAVGASPLGEALSLLDRPPELHIRFRLAGGEESPPYRFVPAIAGDGLLLSAYVPDTVALAEFALGRFGEAIVAFQVTSDAPQAAYQGGVGVTYFTAVAA